MIDPKVILAGICKAKHRAGRSFARMMRDSIGASTPVCWVISLSLSVPGDTWMRSEWRVILVIYFLETVGSQYKAAVATSRPSHW